MKTRFGWIILSTALASAVSLMLVGCNKAPETSAANSNMGTTDPAVAMAPDTTVGTEIDDSVITASVKSALLADADVKSFDLKVETRKGIVQLSGFVDNQTQIDRAITVARGVSGVKNIENSVTLKAAPTTVGNKVDDATITTKVKAALLADTNIKSFDVGVVTRMNEVQLSGFADSQGQIDRVIEVTRSVEGVSSVKNEMSVKK